MIYSAEGFLDSPEKWESYIIDILRLHHGPTGFVHIPDVDQGDLGMEGFSRSPAIVYQCYCSIDRVERPSARQLYEKLRDKIATDIKKFVDNEKELGRLFGDLKIGVWALVVPRSESRQIVEYTTKKAAEIRAKGLPYVDTNFEIAVLTDRDFPEERAKRLALDQGGFEFIGEAVGHLEREKWIKEHPGRMETIKRKVEKLPKLADRPTDLNIFVSDMVKSYLEKENKLEEFRNTVPDLYHKLEHVRTRKEELLSTELVLMEGAASEIIRNVIRDYESDIREAVPALGKETRGVFVYGDVADWLLRCPLEV